MIAKEIAARAVAAKFGGRNPDVRDIARDLLAVLAELEDAQAAIRRARGVIQHWRSAADEADEKDTEATANLPAGEDRPVVTYVPASEGLRLAANRLEDALDGW